MSDTLSPSAQPVSLLIRDAAFVLVDVETTGLNPSSEYICEICVQVFCKGALTEQYCTFVKPSKDIPEETRRIHGISRNMVEPAPTFAMIADELTAYIEGKVACGYNVGFDLDFVSQEFQRIGKPFLKPAAVDLLKICRDVLPGLAGYSLSSVGAALGFSIVNLHRAYPDVCLEAALFKRFIELLEKKKVTTLAQLIERYSG